MELTVFGDRVLFRAGPFSVTETMATSLAVSSLLLLWAWWSARAVRRGSRQGLAVAAIVVVEFIDHLVRDIVGRPSAAVSTLAGSLFLFIAACNLAGQLPGVHPATGNLATTSALAAVVFLSVPIAGVASRGFWEYVRDYFRPNPLLMPLHVISEISRTLALAMRLFGNVMSGHLVVGLLVALAGVLVPTPLMALDLLIGLLQAYIFAVLTIVYVGAAIRAGEDSAP